MSFLALFVIAAIGYVPDSRCASCHPKIAQTYHDVGMSKSFDRPRQEDSIEDFSKLPFRHAKSGETMELRWRNGRLIFRRWTGNGDNLFEQPVDWILGSGHPARTYVYRIPNGELYQLPLAWYSQTREWGMAPGFDRPDHQGVLRRARRECLFCHDAYTGAAADATDGYWREQGVPAALPEGIGCQRCHGPGEEHVRRAASGEDDAPVRAAIVNPLRLDPQRRNDVCYECHMQASVVVPGIRRFGRDIESFRPGQLLSDSIVRLDIDDAGIPRSDRFEINHHPYRLEQSRCFRESGGKLSCLNCHDPHRKTGSVREVCLGCHTTAHRAKEECATCHMQKRRTQDVVRVVMTDHRIGLPSTANLLAPRDEREPVIDDLELLDARDGDEIYRVVAAVRAGSTAAARRLEEMLAAKPSPDIEPYLDLAAAQLRQRRVADLEKTTRLILARAPDQPLALEWLAIARANLGFRDEAIELLRKSAKLDPDHVETWFHLGDQLQARGERGDAIAAFRRAVAGRPNFIEAWIRLGELGDVDAYRRALAIDPHSKALKNSPATTPHPSTRGGTPPASPSHPSSAPRAPS